MCWPRPSSTPNSKSSLLTRKAAGRLKKTFYNTIYEHHRYIRQFLRFLQTEKPQLDKLAAAAGLSRKIAADFQTDLLTTSHPAHPNVDRIERYLRHHIFQLQNPTPNVRLAFHVLSHRSYDVLPSCLKSFDSAAAFKATVATCRHHMTRLDLKLLKLGFSSSFRHSEGLATFENRLVRLTFGLHLYPSEPRNTFWVLTDFELPDSRPLEPELKAEMVSIAANCVASILLSGKDFLALLLEKYLLYFVTGVLRTLLILDFLKRLRKTKQADRLFRVLELKTPDEDTSVSVVLGGFPGLPQTKFSFDLPDYFRLESLVESKLDLLVSQILSLESLSELEMTSNRRLVGVAEEFWDANGPDAFHELSEETQLRLFRSLKVRFDSNEPEKLIRELREVLLLEVYGSLAETITNSGELGGLPVRLMAWRGVPQLRMHPHLNGKGSQLSAILRQTLGEEGRTEAFRLVAELPGWVVVVSADDKLLAEEWTLKGRVKCLQETEGGLVSGSHPLKERLGEAIKRMG